MRKGSGGSGAAGLFNPVALHHHLHNPLSHPLLHGHHHQPPVGGPIIPPHLSLPGQVFNLHHQQQQLSQHLQQQQQQQHHPHSHSQPSHLTQGQQGHHSQGQQQSHHHSPQTQQGAGSQQQMVQQRANPTPGGGSRVYVNNHHTAQGAYLTHQTGLILQQGQHHNVHHPPVGGPLQHTAQMHGHHPGQRPIIPHGGAGFGNHPSGMGQGYMGQQSGPGHGGYGNNAGINSHFGTTGSRGLGENREGVGSSAGGDLPPVETVVARLETACRLLHGIGGNNTRVQEIGQEIQVLSEDLRRVGALLENTYPEVLDRVMSSMRDASAQPCLPPSLRLAIFELVELRASKWILPSDSSNYYRQRRNLNDAAQPNENILEERSGRSSSASSSGVGVQTGGGSSPQVTVVVTTPPGGNNGNTVSLGVGTSSGGGGPGSASPINNNQAGVVDLDTPPQPQPAKTFREEIVIKNSDSGKVAPTAKERVLSINGYSQQSINLAKQLIQETITRNASPVLDGMVLPGSSSTGTGASSDLLDNLGVDDAELALKRMQLQTSSGGAGPSSGASKLGSDGGHHTGAGGSHHGGHGASHFSYTVTLGEHSIKILGDDLQYVQEAKMALDDYFLQKYPDLFCANVNGIEDVEEEDEEGDEEEEEDEDDDEDFHDTCLQRYDRETLLSLSKVRTPPPNFSHLEPDIRGNIVLEKPRQFDLEKFSRETTSTSTTGTGSSTPMVSAPSSTPSTPSTPTAINAAGVVGGAGNTGVGVNALAAAAAVAAAATNNNKTADSLPG